MSNVLNFPNEKLAYEQAGTWIARLDRGLSAAERLELQQWLNADTRHPAVLLELAELWDGMDVMAEIAELFPLNTMIPESSWRPSRRVVPSLSVALTLVVVAVLVAFLAAAPGPFTFSNFSVRNLFVRQTLEASYQTQVGEQRPVTLPDKSIVTLNTNTLLRVHYNDSYRKIELVSGEAHFAVAKHDRRVFIVQVGESEFRAVGTAFNVRVNSERGVELTVTEGRVKVLVAAAGEVKRTKDDVAAEQMATEIMVDAGKEVAIGKATQTVEWVQPEKIDAAIAWTRGMIVFDGDPLERAVREVSRYSNVKFVIADDKIRKIPVAGYFKVGDVDGLVVALQNNFDVDSKRQGDSIVLSAHRP